MALIGKKRSVIEFLRKVDEQTVKNRDQLFKQAEELVVLFNKVLKGYKLYPVNNPIFKQFADDFHNKLQLVHSEIPVIPFRMDRNNFIFMKQPIECEESVEVAYLLFNDGIRELFFEKGISRDEILDLFKILAKVTVYASEDYDIATLIWNENFSHIGYVTEEELIPSEPFEDDDFDQVFDLDAIKTAIAMKPEEVKAESEIEFPEKQDFRLSRKYRDSFLQRVGIYNEEKIVRHFLMELAQKLFSTADYEVKRDLFNTASVLWEKLVLFGAVKEGVYFLKALVKIADRMEKLKDPFLPIVKNGLARLDNIEFLSDVFRGADEMDPENIPHFGELLAMFNQNLLEETVLRITDLSNRDVRIKSLEKIALSLNSLEPVKILVKNPNWMIVRNGLTILKKSSDPARIAIIRSVINSEFKQIREEALSIFFDVATEEALPVLEKSVFSPEEGIRVMSVKKLIESDNAKVKNILNRVFHERHLSSLTAEEIAHYFDLVIDKKRRNLYDLIAVLMNVKNPTIAQLARKKLSKIADFSEISRQIARVIDSPAFLTMDKRARGSFLTMVTPVTYEDTLPALERVFSLKGTLFARDTYRELKESVISHVSANRTMRPVKQWLQKGLNSGNKETVKIIKENGGI